MPAAEKVSYRVRCPAIAYPSLHVVRFSEPALTSGIELHRFQGLVVREYGIGMTVADCFTPMRSRNPILHYVFSRMELAEERGLGLKSMRARATAAGLPLPHFAWEAPYLVLTIRRSPEAAVRALGGEVAAALSKAERTGWAWLASKESVTVAQYQAALNLPNRTAKNHLKKLMDLGLLKRVGAGRATRYLVGRS